MQDNGCTGALFVGHYITTCHRITLCLSHIVLVFAFGFFVTVFFDAFASGLLLYDKRVSSVAKKPSQGGFIPLGLAHEFFVLNMFRTYIFIHSLAMSRC